MRNTYRRTKILIKNQEIMQGRWQKCASLSTSYLKNTQWGDAGCGRNLLLIHTWFAHEHKYMHASDLHLWRVAEPNVSDVSSGAPFLSNSHTTFDRMSAFAFWRMMKLPYVNMTTQSRYWLCNSLLQCSWGNKVSPARRFISQSSHTTFCCNYYFVD